MTNDFICQARVSFRGESLHLNKIVAQIELDDILPPRGPFLNPFDMHRVSQADERRQRLVDYIAAEFAHSLTEAIYKVTKR